MNKRLILSKQTDYQIHSLLGHSPSFDQKPWRWFSYRPTWGLVQNLVFAF